MEIQRAHKATVPIMVNTPPTTTITNTSSIFQTPSPDETMRQSVYTQVPTDSNAANKTFKSLSFL